jgi:hypothetical protein
MTAALWIAAAVAALWITVGVLLLIDGTERNRKPLE